ncbi:hypothetical protein [Pseudoalteromonas luteoviolacea]|uniref:Uncharacterized protein n=1 Tax=Pseudoalteromonas luteoviolacea S4060-1 TaxID=1365257 RepID=A0A162BRU7_9GAMM|nr:hypothetical protein [Pseudoalteromonas luteoviolacea]KZN67305.1 hypothetical protein N478_17940 [Pseudoalteromonas luteoviolacea S4060-1]
MAINKAEAKDVNTKPALFNNWPEAVKANAVANGLSSLNTSTDHHIMPQNQIIQLRNEAIDGTDSNVLLSVAKEAARINAIAAYAPEQQQVDELMSRILWSFGNIIPGPSNTNRIDDPMGTGGWEQAGAVNVAYQYAQNLKIRLKAVRDNPTRDNWMSLVHFVNPQGEDCVAAQQDIETWSDSWATHPVYKIYVRLDAASTQKARDNYDSFLGFGAWIDPRNEELNAIAKKLAYYENMINDSETEPDKDAARAQLRSNVHTNAVSWLAKQPSSLHT